MYQLREAVGEVDGLALHVDVDTLVVDGVLKIEDIIDHGTAERDDKQVGQNHPDTGPPFDMLSHSFRKNTI